MPTLLHVLTDAEIAEIHEKSLAVLAGTGMRIDSERARRLLGAAGATVDEADRRVRFPRALVEASLAAAPRRFSLGGRRPGFAVPMNAGECTLMPDGETTMFYDPATRERRAPTPDDWANATRLCDTMYLRETVFLVAVFDDAETYRANANSPEQDARYRELRVLLEEDPDWMDGRFEGG